MSHKPIRFVKKITAALLFGAFLSFGCVDAYALTLVKEEEEARLPTPDYDAQVAALKDTFIGLYWNLWAQRNMSERLYDCADLAVKDCLGNLTHFTAFAAFAGGKTYKWITEKVYKDALEKAYREAPENLNNRFSFSFNPLLRELQEQFVALYSAQVMMYYWELLEETLEKADNPAIMAKLKAGSDKFFKDPALRQEFASGTRKGGSNLLDGIDIIYNIVGLPDKVNTYNNIIKSASELIGEEIDLLSLVEVTLNELGFTAATSLFAQVGAFLASPEVAAAREAALEVYRQIKFVVKVTNGSEDMRNVLYDPVHRYYLYVMPEKLWKQMEKPVRANLQEVFAQSIFGVADAK